MEENKVNHFFGSVQLHLTKKTKKNVKTEGRESLEGEREIAEEEKGGK
jgi:hypothetical protein